MTADINQHYITVFFVTNTTMQHTPYFLYQQWVHIYKKVNLDMQAQSLCHINIAGYCLLAGVTVSYSLMNECVPVLGHGSMLVRIPVYWTGDNLD